MFGPPLHLLCTVGDHFARGGFQWGCLDGAGAEGFFHALVHGANVSAVGRPLDVLTQVLPVVVGALLGNALGVTTSLSKGG